MKSPRHSKHFARQFGWVFLVVNVTILVFADARWCMRACKITFAVNVCKCSSRSLAAWSGLPVQLPPRLQRDSCTWRYRVSSVNRKLAECQGRLSFAPFALRRFFSWEMRNLFPQRTGISRKHRKTAFAPKNDNFLVDVTIKFNYAIAFNCKVCCMRSRFLWRDWLNEINELLSIPACSSSGHFLLLFSVTPAGKRYIIKRKGLIAWVPFKIFTFPPLHASSDVNH